MSSSWYRRGTVTVTDGSKEVVGVGTLWVDAGNKPLAGDIMFIAGSIYEVESITDNEHLSLFRPFTGVPPANGEYAIIRNTSVTIATRVAAMVAAAINSKQVLLDDLRGYYTSTADKVLIHTDDGSTIEVVPLQTLVSDITNLIAQSESIKNDLANTQAALDLVRQYSNAAQGVEVEPGKYSAKSYAADAADTLALVNKAKSDVDLKASQVQQTKTDIEQFVSTSKTEIDAKATAISEAIDTQATTVKGEITALTSTSKQEITALATQSKKDITTLTTTSKSEISELVAGGTNSITSLTDTSKGAINTLVSASKTEITELATTEKAAISQQSTTAISEMTSLKQSAEQAASTATQKATQAAASATSAAQSKTDAQTLKTQTEALANETKQVAEEIKSGSYVGWQIYCQSEANMKAQRALASNEFAASGFVHYGRGYTGSSPANGTLINEGLWSRTVEASLANALLMGRTSPTSNNGTSKTLFPVTHIAGFISNLFFNENGGNYTSAIKFPDAPNGTVVYDSTGNCRGSGKATLDLTKDVDPKYGDVAPTVNEAVARAFEGLVKSGDFRNPVFWNVTGSGASVDTTGITMSGNCSAKHTFDFKDNTDYEIEFTVTNFTGGEFRVIQYGNAGHDGTITYVRGNGTYKIKWNSNDFSSDWGTNGILSFLSENASTSAKITNVRLSSPTEEVVINRVDMFGFEYWLEEVTEVFHNGCIQSKATSIEGIATKDSTRPDTYFAVFDGDTTSKGKCVVWNDLTNEQKIKLVSNPDHNLFLMDDGRLVQWRVRQRTFAAAKNGKWGNTNPAVAAGYSWLDCGGGSYYPQPQGSSDYVVPTVQNWVQGEVFGGMLNQNIPAHLKHQGVFTAIGEKGRITAHAVDGECYFQVCGVVPRLNQGAYHPTFNPMGAAAWHKWGVAADLPWYDSRVVSGITSAGKCFTEVSASTQIAKTPGSGRISHGKNKRPDGKFYDAIYASGQGGVIDYRLSAWDMSSKEEAAKIFQKVVNGTYRGEETLYGSKVYRIGTATTGFSVNNYRRFDCASVTDVGLTITVGKGRADNTPHNDLNTPRLGFIYDAKTGGLWKVTSFIQDEAGVSRIYTSLASEGAPAGTYTDLYFIGSPNAPYVTTGAQGSEIDNLYTSIPVSGNFTQVDVVGSPANILATPTLANGWIGSWNPKFHTNYNTIVGTRKNVLGSVARRYTDNLGTAWGSDSPAWDSAKNTFVASSLQPTGRVELWEYTAFAKQTKSSTNKPVLNGVEGLGCVYATARGHKDDAVLLTESLMGKVLTSTAAPYAQLKTFENTRFGAGGTINQYPIAGSHSPIEIMTPNNDSPAVKTLWYQIANNQQCSLNFAWNELVWKNLIVKDVNTASSPVKQGEVYVIKADVPLKGQIFKANGNNAGWNWSGMYMGDEGEVYYGGGDSVSLDTTVKSYQGKSDGWGDDSTVRIIDGIGTFINLNGDTCLYGTHELAIPYGYTKNKARACSQVSGVDL
ncbi:methyl-accepting chemotaxis protein [Vibrio parahaemolyticus]|nr:methyl-accepting chemotaxis protein [Vibrio parahaemolyticus]EJG1299412.1 methyl-accepting chemotaxis protein [Vibrio parahaemolyticus]EJG1332108.1 methyl-accepting chemotaxis protein [Vibrio parahaemolyticus]MCF9342487.1 methyl-accepting chemotaxis protein [Vibrio parahaemolyticus]MCF9348373.1 methyl-accepting chemotaxis protein [Vibrio parahaemolyticus]